MRYYIFILLYKLGIPYLLRRSKRNNVTVLNFHRISDEHDFFFPPIKPMLFEKLLVYCMKHYSIISFEMINEETEKPKMILSFDDGYYDFIEYAIPILNKYKIPSNHNLVNICLNENEPIWTQVMNDIFNHMKLNSIIDDDIVMEYGTSFQNANKNWISYYNSFFQYMLKLNKSKREEVLEKLIHRYSIKNSSRMMSWDDARLCLNSYQVEIGSHSYSHDNLSSTTNHETYNYEIKKSIDELEEKLKTKINIIALPNGQFNKSCIDYCHQLTVKNVLLVNDQLNEVSDVNNNFNLINRVYLVNESIEEMILRVELFHSKIKR